MILYHKAVDLPAKKVLKNQILTISYFFLPIWFFTLVYLSVSIKKSQNIMLKIFQNGFLETSSVINQKLAKLPIYSSSES